VNSDQPCRHSELRETASGSQRPAEAVVPGFQRRVAQWPHPLDGQHGRSAADRPENSGWGSSAGRKTRRLAASAEPAERWSRLPTAEEAGWGTTSQDQQQQGSCLVPAVLAETRRAGAAESGQRMQAGQPPFLEMAPSVAAQRVVSAAAVQTAASDLLPHHSAKCHFINLL